MNRIDEHMKIITHGVETIVNEDQLRSKIEASIKSQQPLNIKLGLDPSAPDIHIGHAVVLRKMKQMQNLGHHVTIIIGDFTGKIGDPTGKSKTRNALTTAQVEANAKTYFEQIFKILDKNKTTVHYNSEWLSNLSFETVLHLASSITVARMLERDDFKNRYHHNLPIGLHEFFYPLMQAYDSLHINADIELGGTDQTFNILMGRTLQRHMHQEQQIALFMPLLIGLDGKEKMSKSLGNYIGISEPAEIIFKKAMEIPDDLIITYYTLATDIHPDEIHRIEAELKPGKNPRDVKLHLAQEITQLYHDDTDVQAAIRYYTKAFAQKEIPDVIPELNAPENATLESIAPILVQKHLIQSKSELRRLIQGQGVRINTMKIEQINTPLHNEDVIRIGKKTFIRIRFSTDNQN